MIFVVVLIVAVLGIGISFILIHRADQKTADYYRAEIRKHIDRISKITNAMPDQDDEQVTHQSAGSRFQSCALFVVYFVILFAVLVTAMFLSCHILMH